MPEIIETPETKPLTAEQKLEKRLQALRAEKDAREEARRLGDLERQIAAAELDAKAEEIADALTAIGARGVDFEVVTAEGAILAFGRPPGPAWEKFQRFVTKLITKDEAVPAHEYRNLAKSCLLKPEGAEFAELASKEDLEALCGRFANLGAKIVNGTLHDLAEGGAKRRTGK